MGDGRRGPGGRPPGGRDRSRPSARPPAPGRGDGPVRRRHSPAASTGGDSSSASASPARRRPRSRSTGLTGRAAVLLLVLAALVVSYASSLRAWADQRSQIAALEAEAAERERAVAELDTELRRWQDPAYVRAQARKRFGWVMPGETGYVVVGGDDALTQNNRDQTDPTRREAQHPAWWSTLWGSVEYAGDPPPKPAPKSKPTPAATITPETEISDDDGD